jgi:hypothetical protein
MKKTIILHRYITDSAIITYPLFLGYSNKQQFIKRKAKNGTGKQNFAS